MCGICGIVSNNGGAPISESLLRDMTDRIRHRGPDEDGYYVEPFVGLGSRRLSIIDLDGGRQPIANEDETLWIVYNGETYNYRELQRYLRHRGHEFRTETDTEVVLHLYEELGADCLELLNGIFAFAIWDTRKQELFLARDRMGIKPLYYTQVGDQLIFGSEMKTILTHPDVQRDVDLISLNEYLSFEYVPTPRSIVRNVFRLPPGHYVQYRNGTARVQAYWNIDLTPSETRPPVHWRDYSMQLDEVLRDSVKQEVVSDVPVGVLLSGGVDSSTIAALMAQIYPGTVDSFSVGFEEASFDESEYARMVSEHVGTRHHELILTSKMAAELVPTVMDFLDEPFGDSSLLPTFLLSRFAAEHVKVVLGGDGGDELFAGYPTLKAHKLIGYYERVVPRWVRSYVAPRMLRHLPVSFDNISFDFKVRRFLAGRGLPLQARHHRWLGSFYEDEKQELLQPWIQPVLRETYTPAYEHARASGVREPLNELLYADMKLYLEGDILYKVDRASMANSLEVRVPFLNRNVTEFVNHLPVELKLHGFTSKYLLKKTMERALPKTIIKRPKKGFNMPVARWLKGELRELARDMLAPDRLRRQGLFNPDYVQGLFDSHGRQEKDNRKVLWTLLVFSLWHARYIEAAAHEERAARTG